MLFCVLFESPCTAPIGITMTAAVERFDDAAPNCFSLECSNRINGLDMFRLALVHGLNRFPYFANPFPQGVSHALNHR